MTGKPLNRRIRIERPVISNVGGRAVVTWTLVAVVWANVLDSLPARSEAVRNGLLVGRDSSVIEYAFRSDVDSTMRVIVGGRTMQIIAGPAELGMHWRSQIAVEAIKL